MVALPSLEGVIKELGSLRNPDGTFIPGIAPTGAGRRPGDVRMPNLGGPITQETLDKLETFSKSELIKLIRKVSGAIWAVGIMTDDEAFDAACLKLLHGGLIAENINSAIPALKEWADRKRGKPSQSIAMTVKDEGLGKLSDDRLLKLEQELARMTGQDALLIAPLPKLLDD